MKKGRLMRLLSVILTISLCIGLAVPTYALNWSDISDFFSGWKNPWGGGNSGDNNENDDSDSALTLIEDETTVADGVSLRASTYSTGSGSTADVKYFPVTLYNYDTDTINNVTHQLEVDKALASDEGISGLTEWKGMYFSGGNPSATPYTNGDVSITYRLVEVIIGDIAKSTDWTETEYYYYKDGSYKKVYAKKNEKYNNTTTYEYGYKGNVYSYTTIALLKDSSKSVELYQNGLSYANHNYWKKSSSGTNAQGQWTYSGLVEKKLSNGNIVFTVPEPGLFTTDDVDGKSVYTNVELPFEYNAENNMYEFDGTTRTAYFSGTPTSNTKLERPATTYTSTDVYISSIATKTSWTKTQYYYNVGDSYYPVYAKKETSRSGFGSTTTYYYGYSKTDSVNDVEEIDNSTQWNKTINLYTENNTVTQWYYDKDDKTNKLAWFPFNKGTGLISSPDYHFGMQANIEFGMTSDGKISETPITFDFSGDDDVWVFIDGILVLDIGGIHNSLGGTINFAENTWSIGRGSNNNKTDDVKDANNKDQDLSGDLFGDKGVLGQSLETFASQTTHQLTIFYLERGEGSSNCQIKFNLPLNDTVSVQKIVNEKDDEGNTVSVSAMETINNTDFGFTLVKNDSPVANATYALYDKSGIYISTASTDSAGHFTIRNGQKAVFIGNISDTGDTFYVKEDEPSTVFNNEKTTWSYQASVANGSSSKDNLTVTTSLTSPIVTVKGSGEHEDSLSFVCTNTVHHVNETKVVAQNDTIVIDYGLPVLIDVLSNDSAANADYKAIKSVEIEGTEYGKAEISGDKIKFTLTKQLTGIQKLKYTVVATKGNDTYESTAYVYIIPATTMYYEENFLIDENTSMIEYKGTGWTPVTTDGQDSYQEPGVVGTANDSPYGSDVAYLDDSADSNGTSMYVDTSNSAAKFSYTFTGTGTSFFARTTQNSGYIQIVVKGDNGYSYTSLRDTRFIQKSGDEVKENTLYNIPVFTIDELNYGTYTVEVSIADTSKAKGYGSDFWLDGIRVFNPVNATDAEQAKSAYSADGESNMTYVTLRDKLLTDYTTDDNGNLIWDGKNFVLFTDSDGQIKSASEYKSNGPKEEVYLAKGQSISFSLVNYDISKNKIYLGIKAPMGNGSVQIGSNKLDIKNTPDCYYNISDGTYVSITGTGNNKVATYTITNTGDNIISLTNIKVTGNAEFTIIGNANVDNSNTSTESIDIHIQGYFGEDNSVEEG